MNIGYKFPLIILFSFFLNSTNLYSKSKISVCHESILKKLTGLKESVSPKLKEFKDDFINTRGVRIFLRKTKDTDTGGFVNEVTDSDLKWYKTLDNVFQAPFNITSRYLRNTEVGYHFNITQNYLNSADKGLHFTPIKGTYHQLVRRPFNALTSKNKFLGNTPREPTFTANLVTSSLFSYFVLYPQMDKYFENKKLKIIEENPEKYDRFYNEDYRFADILFGLKSGKITPKEARLKTSERLEDINDYNKFAKEKFDHASSQEKREKLLAHPLFREVAALLFIGVKKNPSFIIPDDSVGTISIEQADELIYLNHIKLKSQQIVVDSFSREDSMQPIGDEQYYNLMNDEFTQALIYFEKEGKITKKQLIRYLQEDLDWQYKFEMYKTIGIQKKKRTKDSKSLTNTPLELDDIRFQIIDEILGR